MESMNEKRLYNIQNKIDAEDIKYFRTQLGLSQGEFARMLGISRPTVERMEKTNKVTEGPVAALIDLLSENLELVESRIIPPKEYPIRMWYMYRDKKITLIDVDEINQKVRIVNYTKNIIKRAFGANENPSYEDYKSFLKSRCFPETRDKVKIQLESLGLPYYDPWMIVKKTQGRMAEDHFWINIQD